MRRSEVLGLRWLDLDLVHGRIMLSQTKNGESRIVYLNKAAQSAVESLALTPIPSLLTNCFRALRTIK
jgi:integrase